MTALYVTLSKFLQGQQGRSQNCLIMHSLKEHLYHRYFLLSLVIFNCNLWIKSEHLISKHLFLILYFNRLSWKEFCTNINGTKKKLCCREKRVVFLLCFMFLTSTRICEMFSLFIRVRSNITRMMSILRSYSCWLIEDFVQSVVKSKTQP